MVFNYMLLIGIVHMVLEFITCMLALSIVKNEEIGPNGSILQATIELRKSIMKNRPSDAGPVVTALIIFNHARNISGVLIFIIFVFVIVSVIVGGMFGRVD